MAKTSRPAKAAAAQFTSAESPLDAVFAAMFEAVDAGDFDRRDALLKAATQTAVEEEQEAAPVAPAGPSAILIEKMVTVGVKDRMAHAKPYARLTKPVPFVTRGNPAAIRARLLHRRPHLIGVIDTILTDLAPREIIRLRPTVLVGPPGCGKTTLARAIAAECGLPLTVFPAAGVHDGMFGGTSANWSNSAPSLPVQILLQHAVANPVLVIDEVDKATQGSHNGSLLDALLGFLDRGNASVFRDPSLEATVDCSHLNWILTANDIKSIPAPLRDRCRIIRVPDPEWRHIGEISRSILDSIADDRDLDRRWLPDLDADETRLIGRHWRGGSLRKLVRIVEVIVDGRDRHMSRA